MYVYEFLYQELWIGCASERVLASNRQTQPDYRREGRGRDEGRRGGRGGEGRGGERRGGEGRGGGGKQYMYIYIEIQYTTYMHLCVYT